MSIAHNWICHYNGEAHLKQLVYAEDAESAVRWFLANVEHSWDREHEPIYIWVRPPRAPRAMLFVAEHPRDPPRTIYELRL